jgi:hypothetical protein
MRNEQDERDSADIFAYRDLWDQIEFPPAPRPPRPGSFLRYLPPNPKLHGVMLHLGIRTSFGNPYSYIVKTDFVALDRDWSIVQPILYHAVWDENYDHWDVLRLNNARTKATVRVRQVALDHHFNELIQEGREIKVPFIGTRFPIGYDGGTIYLWVFMEQGVVDLNWWSTGPEGWQPLDEWTLKLQRYFVELLKDQPIVGEDTRTNPVAMWNSLLDTCGRNWNLGTKMRFEYEKRSVKEMMPSLEAALSVKLPEYQRQILTLQYFPDEINNIRLLAVDGTFFHLHTPEKILELREDATIPRTIHDTPVIPSPATNAACCCWN